MRLAQQWISGLLALGLVFAGCVTFSPVLHVLIEHGGRGSAHVHLHRQDGYRKPGRSTFRQDADSTRLASRQGRPGVIDRTRVSHVGLGGAFRSLHRPFDLPRLAMEDVLNRLQRCVRWPVAAPEAAQDSDPSSSSVPSNEHHGLTRTLADGCLGHPLEVALQILAPVRLEFRLVFTNNVWVSRFSDAQTFGRAPPTAS